MYRGQSLPPAPVHIRISARVQNTDTSSESSDDSDSGSDSANVARSLRSAQTLIPPPPAVLAWRWFRRPSHYQEKGMLCCTIRNTTVHFILLYLFVCRGCCICRYGLNQCIDL